MLGHIKLLNSISLSLLLFASKDKPEILHIKCAQDHLDYVLKSLKNRLGMKVDKDCF